MKHLINAAIIPTEEEARDYPRLEAERERKLELLAEQKDRRLVAVHRLERIDARLDAINRALELLPSDAQAAEAALVAPEDQEAPQAPRRPPLRLSRAKRRPRACARP